MLCVTDEMSGLTCEVNKEDPRENLRTGIISRLVADRLIRIVISGGLLYTSYGLCSLG